MLVNQLARMDLGSIENTLAPNLCPLIIWRDPTSVSRSNTNSDSVHRPDIICSPSGTRASKLRRARCISYIFPLQISFWCCRSCTSFPSVIFGTADNGVSWEPVIRWGWTSLKIMICLKWVSRWGRQAGICCQWAFTSSQRTHRVLINKALHDGGLISWRS